MEMLTLEEEVQEVPEEKKPAKISRKRTLPRKAIKLFSQADDLNTKADVFRKFGEQTNKQYDLPEGDESNPDFKRAEALEELSEDVSIKAHKTKNRDQEASRLRSVREKLKSPEQQDIYEIGLSSPQELLIALDKIDDEKELLQNFQIREMAISDLKVLRDQAQKKYKTEAVKKYDELISEQETALGFINARIEAVLKTNMRGGIVKKPEVVVPLDVKKVEAKSFSIEKEPQEKIVSVQKEKPSLLKRFFSIFKKSR